MTFRLRLEDQERLEALCLRRAYRDPRHEGASVQRTIRLAVLRYLAEAEAEEALVAPRARPACVVARMVGGLRWCPDHDAQWMEGETVPESCRGDE